MRLFLSDDLIAEYVRQAQQDLGVKVNQDALRRAVSGSEQLIPSCSPSRPSRPSPRAIGPARPSVVRASLVGDLETPVAAFLKLRQGHEGAASSSNRSRAARCAAATR